MSNAKLWTKNYIFVMLSNFSAAFSHSAFATIIALYVSDIGGNNRIAGLMAGGMTLAMMCTRPLVGNLLDRVGRRPIIILGGFLFAFNTMAYLFAASLAVLVVIRIIHGFSQVFYTVSTTTIVSDVVPEERMVDGLGYYGISSSIAGALGPMIGLGVYQQFGSTVLFAMMTVFAMLGAFAAMAIRTQYRPRLRGGEQTSSAPRGLAGLIELSTFAPGLIHLAVAFSYSSVGTFLTTCGQARGIASISLYFTVCSCAMIATRLFAGKLTLRFGFSRPIFAGLCMMVSSVLLIAFAQSLAPVVLAGALYGLGNGLVTPILQVLVFRLCAPDRKGAANATYGLFNDVGSGIGGSVWGFATLGIGYTATYLCAAGCLSTTFLTHQFYLKRKMREKNCER